MLESGRDDLHHRDGRCPETSRSKRRLTKAVVVLRIARINTQSRQWRNMEKRGVIGDHGAAGEQVQEVWKPRQKLMFPLVGRWVHDLEQSRLQGYVSSIHSGYCNENRQ